MKIEHFALWTPDLERMKAFYVEYFQASAGAKYANPTTGFSSYFISFESGARMELMTMPGILPAPAGQAFGYIHLAVSAGSAEAVDALAEKFTRGGCPPLSPPRWTGDGYYEFVVLDPDGNRVEITI